jgi:hypothetical protein
VAYNHFPAIIFALNIIRVDKIPSQQSTMPKNMDCYICSPWNARNIEKRHQHLNLRQIAIDNVNGPEKSGPSLTPLTNPKDHRILLGWLATDPTCRCKMTLKSHYAI